VGGGCVGGVFKKGSNAIKGGDLSLEIHGKEGEGSVSPTSRTRGIYNKTNKTVADEEDKLLTRVGRGVADPVVCRAIGGEAARLSVSSIRHKVKGKKKRAVQLGRGEEKQSAVQHVHLCRGAAGEGMSGKIRERGKKVPGKSIFLLRRKKRRIFVRDSTIRAF